MNGFFGFIISLGIVFTAVPVGARDIIHDAEYYLLEAQNGERWQEEDKLIEKRLAEIRKANGGKPPNIVYILLDDLGFGDIAPLPITTQRPTALIISAWRSTKITILTVRPDSLRWRE